MTVLLRSIFVVLLIGCLAADRVHAADDLKPQLPTPGPGWRGAELAPAAGYTNIYYGGCRGPVCASLVPAAAYTRKGLRLRAYVLKAGTAPLSPQGPEGQMLTADGPMPAVGAIYEMESDGEGFMWATVPPYVLEATVSDARPGQLRVLRQALQAWLRACGVGHVKAKPRPGAKRFRPE